MLAPGVKLRDTADWDTPASCATCCDVTAAKLLLFFHLRVLLQKALAIVLFRVA
jgi:hypothetical protein